MRVSRNFVLTDLKYELGWFYGLCAFDKSWTNQTTKFITPWTEMA